MQNKYIIIGSNSFSGSSFIDHILDNNEKVIGVSRSKQMNYVYLKYKKNKNYLTNFKFHQIDINKNLNKLINITKEFKPNIIVNFAAQGMVAESWKNPKHWYNTNLLSQVEFFEKIKKMKFIKKFIQFSTPEVYGNTNEKIIENNSFMPSTPYANSRAACDYHLLNLYKEFNFPVIFTRTANVYGPTQQLYRIIPKTIISIKKNLKLKLDGGGNSKRSFINIIDVNQALLKICKDGKNGETYHISTNKYLTIKSLVKKICKRMNVKFDNITQIVPDRIGKDKNYILDSNKLRKNFNWKESLDLDDGIEEVIKWIEENYASIKKDKLYYEHKE